MQPNCSLLSIVRLPSGMVGVSAPCSDTHQNAAITIAEDGASWPSGAGRVIAELDVDDRWVIEVFGTGLVRGVEPGGWGVGGDWRAAAVGEGDRAFAV